MSTTISRAGYLVSVETRLDPRTRRVHRECVVRFEKADGEIRIDLSPHEHEQLGEAGIARMVDAIAKLEITV